jgi:hypothetical protein
MTIHHLEVEVALRWNTGGHALIANGAQISQIKRLSIRCCWTLYAYFGHGDRRVELEKGWKVRK